MSITTLNKETYYDEPEFGKEDFTSSSEIVSCVSTGETIENSSLMPADVMNLSNNEIAEYSIESQKSIMRGLSQTKTHSLGSFAEYVE